MSSTSPRHDDDAALLSLGQALREAGYHFTTITPATHARVNARPENAQARSLADVFGWSRPFQPELLPSSLLQLMERSGVLIRGDQFCRCAVRASTLDGELFFHSAFPTTALDSVFFGPDTYRFAAAIAHALRGRDRLVQRAVDIGCGAGPGGIVAAKILPQAEVFMVDINEAALRLARINARLAGLAGVTARHSNLLTSLEGEFDLVMANPPYLVDPSERAYRHGGGPLGAGLSLAILDTALERLSPGGTLVLYTGAAVVNGDDPFRAAAAARLARGRVRWTYREVDPDVFGEELEAEAYRHADRIAAVVLTVEQDG
ncbi:methyltransferase [Roseomonas sp. BN140053]|uniref:methyltransferase n=1 Tax=Roseomonas sp. BN140053 TaxID=3391898 RepID=UPI0039E84594